MDESHFFELPFDPSPLHGQRLYYDLELAESLNATGFTWNLKKFGFATLSVRKHPDKESFKVWFTTDFFPQGAGVAKLDFVLSPNWIAQIRRVEGNPDCQYRWDAKILKSEWAGA